MGLNSLPSGQRLHIGFFGMRNAGKSSLVNSITGQDLSVVSDVKGTTTDPVQKAMELLPLGPVVVIDTPGLDDEGELGALRMEKTRQVLGKTDLAVLVVDASVGLSPEDRALKAELDGRKLPYVLVWNKADLLEHRPDCAPNEICVSAKSGYHIQELKELMGTFAPKKQDKVLVSDLLDEGDLVVLVTPIDEAAPKGRLILPQQMTIRDILDRGAIAITVQPAQLSQTLASLGRRPKLVITDSQAFGQVSKLVPQDIPLTSFSILMARFKGDLLPLIQGASALSGLKDGDKVLISEGCTHHRQCNDIGTVKLPDWIRNYTRAEPEFHFTSGGQFPDDLSQFALVVHCGGCMLNEAEMKRRSNAAQSGGVPMVNYGLAIAHMNGILKRSLEPIPGMAELFTL